MRALWHRTVAALAAPALFASPLAAGVDRWTQLGPNGGEATSLSIDPADPRILYLVGGSASPEPDRGLYRSFDGGARWTILHRAHVPSPHDPRRLDSTRGL